MSFYQGPGRRVGCTGCSVQVPISRLYEPGFKFPHGEDCKEKDATYTDSSTEEGVTVGLMDMIITAARVLRERKLEGKAITEALKDLRSDPDVRHVIGLE